MTETNSYENFMDEKVFIMRRPGSGRYLMAVDHSGRAHEVEAEYTDPPLQACRQWNALVTALRAAGALVIELPPNLMLPDGGVFTRDLGLVLSSGSSIFVTGEFLHGELAIEERGVREILRPEIFYNLTSPFSSPGEIILEGGDCIPTPYIKNGRPVTFIGHGPHTTKAAIDKAQATFPNQFLVPLRLRARDFYGFCGYPDPPAEDANSLYHLDTPLSIFPKGEMAVYGEALDDVSFRHALWFAEEIHAPVYQLNLGQAKALSANMIHAASQIIIAPILDPDFRGWIEQQGYTSIEVDVSYFTDGWGGPRCMTLEVPVSFLNEKGLQLLRKQNPAAAPLSAAGIIYRQPSAAGVFSP